MGRRLGRVGGRRPAHRVRRSKPRLSSQRQGVKSASVSNFVVTDITVGRYAFMAGRDVGMADRDVDHYIMGREFGRRSEEKSREKADRYRFVNSAGRGSRGGVRAGSQRPHRAFGGRGASSAGGGDDGFGPQGYRPRSEKNLRQNPYDMITSIGKEHGGPDYGDIKERRVIDEAVYIADRFGSAFGWRRPDTYAKAAGILSDVLEKRREFGDKYGTLGRTGARDQRWHDLVDSELVSLIRYNKIEKVFKDVNSLPSLNRALDYMELDIRLRGELSARHEGIKPSLLRQFASLIENGELVYEQYYIIPEVFGIKDAFARAIDSKLKRLESLPAGMSYMPGTRGWFDRWRELTASFERYCSDLKSGVSPRGKSADIEDDIVRDNQWEVDDDSAGFDGTDDRVVFDVDERGSRRRVSGMDDRDTSARAGRREQTQPRYKRRHDPYPGSDDPRIWEVDDRTSFGFDGVDDRIVGVGDFAGEAFESARRDQTAPWVSRGRDSFVEPKIVVDFEKITEGVLGEFGYFFELLHPKDESVELSPDADPVEAARVEAVLERRRANERNLAKIVARLYTADPDARFVLRVEDLIGVGEIGPLFEILDNYVRGVEGGRDVQDRDLALKAARLFGKYVIITRFGRELSELYGEGKAFATGEDTPAMAFAELLMVDSTEAGKFNPRTFAGQPMAVKQVEMVDAYRESLKARVTSGWDIVTDALDTITNTERGKAGDRELHRKILEDLRTEHEADIRGLLVGCSDADIRRLFEAIADVKLQLPHLFESGRIDIPGLIARANEGGKNNFLSSLHSIVARSIHSDKARLSERYLFGELSRSVLIELHEIKDSLSGKVKEARLLARMFGPDMEGEKADFLERVQNVRMLIPAIFSQGRVNIGNLLERAIEDQLSVESFVDTVAESMRFEILVEQLRDIFRYVGSSRMRADDLVEYLAGLDLIGKDEPVPAQFDEIDFQAVVQRQFDSGKTVDEVKDRIDYGYDFYDLAKTIYNQAFHAVDELAFSASIHFELF